MRRAEISRPHCALLHSPVQEASFGLALRNSQRTENKKFREGLLRARRRHKINANIGNSATGSNIDEDLKKLHHAVSTERTP